MAEPDTPEAQPAEVEFSLAWRLEDGHLVGELEARNIGSRAIRLSGKPSLRPVGADGQPLDTGTVVSLELRLPGHVEVEPGRRARAAVGWAGWDGPPARGEVIVGWPGGHVVVTANGPRQPESSGPATNLWSSWFELVEQQAD